MITDDLREQERKLAESDLYASTKSYLTDNHDSILQVVAKMVWTLSIGTIVLLWTVFRMPFRLLPGLTSTKTEPASKAEKF